MEVMQGFQDVCDNLGISLRKGLYNSFQILSICLG